VLELNTQEIELTWYRDALFVACVGLLRKFQLRLAYLPHSSSPQARMSDLLPFWDCKGKVHYLEGFPESWHDWNSSGDETLDNETAQLVDTLEKTFKAKVVSTSLWTHDGVVRKVCNVRFCQVTNQPTADLSEGTSRNL
jgi:hypothetical protein